MMRKPFLVMAVVGVVVATALVALLEVKSTKDYPFSLGLDKGDPRLRVAYANLSTVDWAYSFYLKWRGKDASLADFFASPYGSYLALPNPFQGREARIFEGSPEVVDESVYGDIAIIRAARDSWYAAELRVYTPTLSDGKNYLWTRVVAPKLTEEDESGFGARFRTLPEKEQAVMVYALLLQSRANQVQSQIVDPVKPDYGGGESLEALRRAWWKVNPDAIRNPFTGKPVREVPLSSPSPGDVTFLPIRNPESPQRAAQKLALRFRPGEMPHKILVVAYGENGKPVDPAVLLSAVVMRPKGLPPLDLSVVKPMLSELGFEPVLEMR